MENRIEKVYYDNTKRPVLLILPGGGYFMTSDREAYPIANEFLSTGFHQAIFYYREDKKKYPEILTDAKKHIEELMKDPLIGDIHIMGFSAGGHFAGLLLTEFPEMFKTGILCYPVISTDKLIMHEDSFKNLLKNYPDELDKVSIEKNIKTNTPPMYIWHTMEDPLVPYQNSIVLMEALKEKNIEVKLRLFDKGPHGLALANRLTSYDDMNPLEYEKQYKEIQKWIKDAKEWLLNH
ncbi:alpha/beta hydrolase [Haploplasma axanthum]|uniref:Predicted esterase n=1 Tax=Haploplasma axanthum TaxID=29552 RepID=A0A449BDY5_HAPAX|nr:alpha/beta hydrolase [Haploplasma axanthum]VEU80637.1 Predicted esterase [Haploplasma axanthum]